MHLCALDCPARLADPQRISARTDFEVLNRRIRILRDSIGGYCINSTIDQLWLYEPTVALSPTATLRPTLHSSTLEGTHPH